MRDQRRDRPCMTVPRRAWLTSPPAAFLSRPVPYRRSTKWGGAWPDRGWVEAAPQQIDSSLLDRSGRSVERGRRFLRRAGPAVSVRDGLAPVRNGAAKK